MALLDTTARLRVWAQAMRDPNLGALGGVTKADLRAAIDSLDDWIEANQAAINQAIPQPARGALTLPQKTLLFCWVAMRRAGIHRAAED